MGKYLSLLGVDGTLVNVGAPPEPLEVPAFALLAKRRSWAGSNIGGIRETQEMLDFCAEHDVVPRSRRSAPPRSMRPTTGWSDSDVRYRFVIDTSTF